MQDFQTDYDGSVIIHTFSDSSEAAIDAWGEEVIQVIDATPLEQPFMLLLDVSAKQVSFTRHARQKTQILFTRYRHRRGRYALLFSSKIAPYYSRIFFASLGQLDFELAHFSNREQAIRWLKEAEREKKA